MGDNCSFDRSHFSVEFLSRTHLQRVNHPSTATYSSGPRYTTTADPNPRKQIYWEPRLLLKIQNFLSSISRTHQRSHQQNVKSWEQILFRQLTHYSSYCIMLGRIPTIDPLLLRHQPTQIHWWQPIGKPLDRSSLPYSFPVAGSILSQFVSSLFIARAMRVFLFFLMKEWKQLLSFHYGKFISTMQIHTERHHKICLIAVLNEGCCSGRSVLPPIRTFSSSQRVCDQRWSFTSW